MEVSERLKVLLVDSDQAGAMTLASGLRQRGLDIIFASDGVHTLSAARQTQPDVVVLNSQLAGGGGLAVLKRLGSNVNTAHMPVVAIIGVTETKSGEQFIASGARECVMRPVDITILETAIRRNVLQSLDFTLAPAEIIADPQRLAALEKTQLLDTAPEESFDRLARLVALLLSAPTALMSLVDRDRQFFKSQIGLGLPWAAERQTRLSHSFCQWVVAGREPVVVEDARTHPVLRSNLAIKDLGVVAYLGVPLVAHAGQAIGALCAIDSTPRLWTDDDLATLRDFAVVTEANIVLRGGDAAQASADAARLGSEGGKLQACASSIMALSRILERSGALLGHAERAELRDLIRQHGRQVNQLAG